jgi:predicted nucleotidyltransferase
MPIALKHQLKNMEQKIKKYLEHLESSRNIEILLACETGSRAWGFPSPDSDYDIRIIYKHDTKWYLSLTEEKDTIDEFYENQEIDISGWDLRKSLLLLKKSNVPLLEWIQSPLVYQANSVFLAEINKIAPDYYSKIASIHHYSSMAKNMFKEIKEQENYKLKKFFYAIRAATACLWVLDREEIPPIQFSIMLNQLNLPETVKEKTKQLIELKAFKNEDFLHHSDDELLSFIQDVLYRVDSESNKLPPAIGKIDKLNEFFIKTLDL